jgi:hypothetical protein
VLNSNADHRLPLGVEVVGVTDVALQQKLCDVLIVDLNDCHESLLRNVDLAHCLHSLLSFRLLC